MPRDYLILCFAAAAGGAINAIAGGGTLLTFPALFAALGTSGADAVLANGTSTVALLPGSIAALFGYRREIVQERYWSLALLAPASWVALLARCWWSCCLANGSRGPCRG